MAEKLIAKINSQGFVGNLVGTASLAEGLLSADKSSSYNATELRTYASSCSAAAKAEVVGGASASFDTLGKIQGKIEAMDLAQTGGDYVVNITQEDGKVTVVSSSFVDTIGDDPSTNNAPTVAAVKTHVSGAKAIIDAYTVNGHQISGSPVLNGADIKLDGYVKPTSSSAIAATDTVNAALGKLEKGIEEAVAGGLQKVEAGDGISVSEVANNKQTVSAAVDSTAVAGVKVEISGSKIKANVTTLDSNADITSTATSVVSGKGVRSAIDALTATSVSASGKLVKDVVETNGIITASVDYLADTDIKLESISQSSSSSYAAQYKLVNGNGVQLGETINIAKDQFLKSADFYAKADDVPTEKQDYPQDFQFPGIRFEWQLKSGVTSPTWVSVKDLVDVYTAGNGIDIAKNVISIKNNSSEAAFVTIDANGLKIDGIQNAINDASASVKTYASASVATEMSRSMAAESGLDTRISAVENASASLEFNPGSGLMINITGSFAGKTASASFNAAHTHDSITNQTASVKVEGNEICFYVNE